MGIVTITGSTAFEAAMLNKPAIVLETYALMFYQILKLLIILMI